MNTFKYLIKASKMITNKLQKSILLSTVIIVFLVSLLIGSDTNKTPKYDYQYLNSYMKSSRLMELAEGLPESTIILLTSFDSISNKIDEKLEIYNSTP